MQLILTKSEPGIKQRISVRKVGLLLIVSLLFGLFITDLSVYVRKTVYRAFQQGVRLILNFQTREYAVINSDSFRLKYTAEDQELAPVVLNLAEDYLRQAEEIFGLEHRTRRIPLVLFRDEASLNKSFGWSGEKSTAGVYWAGTIRIVSPRGWAGAPDTVPNLAEAAEAFAEEGPLAHELTHLLVDEICGGNYPRWLTEGLAQYVEQQITGFTLGEPGPSAKAHPYAFAALDKRFDEQEDQYLAYWQSFQAVRQLLARYGQERMTTLLLALGNGQDFAAAFTETYGLTFRDFAESLSSGAEEYSHGSLTDSYGE
ncbi:MAG: peptidase MA family metallohydrolase [Peptococcia bacterium]|jgi:hypothetical protein